MRIIKTSIIALLLISSLTAFAQAEKNDQRTEISENWQSINTSDYSIQYPKDWELNESGLMGASFILFSPISSDQDQFRENVNLIVQDLTGYNIDLDEYVRISEGQIKTLMTDSEIIENKRITDNGLDYQMVIYTGKQGIFQLQFEQYYWVIEEKAYVLTLTCEENQFKDYREVGEGILKSFEVKND